MIINIGNHTININPNNPMEQKGGEKRMAILNIQDFPDDLHRALKVKAAETGTTIKGLIIRYCQEGLQRDKQQNKKRGRW